ncbi:MAG TPA: hypothetical protein VGP94_00245, partial [Tepidisphaeraceae bacterium]|nr:hypothetical protein [Tepidisphaeraceae bacterium]
MVAFAILGVVSQGLVGARALQQHEPDAGLLASELSLTNQLYEGVESGDFEELYPGVYPGYSWVREITEVGSNGLFRVDYVITRGGAKAKGAGEIRSSILLFRPQSPPGSATKGHQ